MANQYQNATWTEKIMQHGEMLVKLTAIVDSLEKKTDKQEEALDLIAKAVARRETRDEFWGKMLIFGLPLFTTLLGALAGHFIH